MKFLGNKGKTRRHPVFRVGIVLLSAIILGGVSLGVGYAHWAVFLHRLTVVSEGKVYRSAEMPMDDLQEAVRRYGFRSVIDLRKEGDDVLTEHSALTKAGIKHFDLPSSQVPTDETVDRFLGIANNPDNLPLLIHCEHGQGRAVLFSAIYRIEFDGWSRERAWRATRFLPFKGSFAADERKGQFLLNYVKRQRRSADMSSADARRTTDHSGAKK